MYDKCRLWLVPGGHQLLHTKAADFWFLLLVMCLIWKIQIIVCVVRSKLQTAPNQIGQKSQKGQEEPRFQILDRISQILDTRSTTANGCLVFRLASEATILAHPPKKYGAKLIS